MKSIISKLRAYVAGVVASAKVRSVARHALTAAAAVLVPAVLNAHGVDLALLGVAGGAAGRVVLLAVESALGLSVA